MLKPEVQQALFDKYAPDPTGAQWDINRFANRIATEPSPRGDWLRKYLHVVCGDAIKTKFNDPDMTEKIEGYIDMSHDVPEKDMLMHIKYNLIEYIANL
jgi:hypothetical protein